MDVVAELLPANGIHSTFFCSSSTATFTWELMWLMLTPAGIIAARNEK